MTSTSPRNRLSPVSVLAVAVVSGLLLALVTLCCCAGEAAAGPVAARSVAALDTAADTASDVVSGAAGHPLIDVDAGLPGDGCDRAADHPVAIAATAAAVARDLTAPVALEPLWTDEGTVRPPVAGGAAARAPASHLLCVMRT